MNIIVKIKNLKLTESLRSFIENKIGGIKKFLKSFTKSSGQNDSLEAFVEVEKETMHHRKGDVFKAETKVNLPGKSFVAQAHGDDLKRAVVEVRDELKREIGKYKTKTIDSPRRKYRKNKREIF